ncbi:HAD-IIIA family hydrolase [Candidatus Pelagibacter sp.]|nr:HAD-IIIA family hydrolase [Candidatus Pelagibacter sp.]
MLKKKNKKLNKKLDLVILVGGKGTRIKKYLNGSPKPMMKFNDKYFLNYIINLTSKYNFKKIYLLTGYKSDIIYKKFHNKIFNFVKIECIKEKKEMGTAGALSSLKRRINDFILLNGDTLFNIDYSKLINSLGKNSYGSISLVKNQKQDSKKLNTLTLVNNLVKYSSKGNLMNGGVYFFKNKFLKFISKKNSSLENDVLPSLINKKKINGKIFNEFFLDIGTENYYKKASALLLKNLKKPAAFLDRDGVINHDYGYVHTLKKFKFKNGVIDGLKYLSKKNYYIFIITNQAGIGKKIYTLEKFIKLHRELKDILIKKKIYINDVKYSPYHVDAKIDKYKKNSQFRKPGNLMIKEIFNNWDISMNKSFMIGDQISDKICAKRSGLYFEFAKDNFFVQVKSIIRKN